VLLVANLVMSLAVIIVIGAVGMRIFDVTSPASLCNTATTCLGNANVELTDALVAGLDPTRWTRVFGDVAKLAKQLRTVDWTLETSQACDFLIHCGDLSHSDCTTFIGDQGGVCDWNDVSAMCESRASQNTTTSKVVSTAIVGCPYFHSSWECQSAVPIPPAGVCNWNQAQYLCIDADSTNPGRVQVRCSEDFKLDNRTQQDIYDTIDRVQTVAQSYRTNATATGVTSSFDITTYIARQLESNWTLTAGACVSLTSAIMGANVSAFACMNDVPQCDNFAQWQVIVSAVNILCQKVQNAHIIVPKA